MDTKQYLVNFYDQCNEDGRLLSRHGMVEYVTTMHYLDIFKQA